MRSGEERELGMPFLYLPFLGCAGSSLSLPSGLRPAFLFTIPHTTQETRKQQLQ